MGIDYSIRIRKTRLAIISIFIFLLFFIVTAGVRAEDASGQLITGNEGQSPFKDLGTDNYYFPYVKFLQSRQIITGFPDSTFRLDGALTRAQVAVTLVKAMGLKDTPASPDQPLFVDIDQSHWAYKQIHLAAQAGILKGYPNGNFGPNEYITRAEAAVLFFRFAKESPEHFAQVNITDVPADHWAYKYVEASVDGNFLAMFDKNKFSPDKSLSRAEWARGLTLVINLSPILGQAPLTTVLLVKEPGVEIKTGDKITVPKQDQKINLNINDQITTKTGIAEIEFPDGTGFKLDSNTEIILKSEKGLSYLLPDGTQKVGVDYLELKLTGGKLLGSLATRDNLKQEIPDKGESQAFNKARQVMVASRQGLYELLADNTEQEELPWYKTTTTKRVRVKVDMPWGVAAIRGTTIYVGVKPDGQSIVSCYHGQAIVQSGAGEVVVEQGKTTAIKSKGQPPETPREQTQEEKQELVRNIEWFNQRIEQQLINKPLEIDQPPPSQDAQQNEQKPAEALEDAIKSIVNNTLSNIGVSAPSEGEQEQVSSTNHNHGQGGNTPNAALAEGTTAGMTRITGLVEDTVYEYVIDNNASDGVSWATPTEATAATGGVIDDVAVDADQYIHIRVKNPVSAVKDLDVAIANLKAAAAPDVVNDDAADTVSGIDRTMEFSTERTSWTTYNADTPNLPDLTGDVTLQVRVRETTKQPAGEIKSLTFTLTLTSTTFAPAHDATGVETNVRLTITFSRAFTMTDGTAIDNANVANLITFKKTNASGADVDFTAEINAAKKVIIVTPDAALDNKQVYYLAVAAVKDSLGNTVTGSSASFTTARVESQATSQITFTITL